MQYTEIETTCHDKARSSSNSPGFFLVCDRNECHVNALNDATGNSALPFDFTIDLYRLGCRTVGPPDAVSARYTNLWKLEKRPARSRRQSDAQKLSGPAGKLASAGSALEFADLQLRFELTRLRFSSLLRLDD